MDREPSSSSSPTRAGTKPNHLLEWVNEPAPDQPAVTPAKAAGSRGTAARKTAPKATALEVTIDDESLGELADAPAHPRPKPAGKPRTKPLTKPREKPFVKPLGNAKRSLRLSRKVKALAVVAVAAVAAYGVYSTGRKPSVPGISGTPTDQSSAAAKQIDSAKVSALMQRISASPKDVSALQSLGDIYFQAGDYKTAGTWESKILAFAPKNVTALLALGACQFNLGDGTGAEKSWLTVLKLNPRQVEAHYDLGFLYLSKNPPEMAKVKKEWTTVVQIDPTSDVAKSVQAHLKSLDARSSAPSSSAGK